MSKPILMCPVVPDQTVSTSVRLAASIRSVVERLEARRLMSVPNGPYALAAAPVSAAEVDLAWASNSSDEAGFTIERSTDGTNFFPVGGVGAGVTAFPDTTASSGNHYYYRVHAFSAGGNSSESNVADVSQGTIATPTPAPTPTPSPTGGTTTSITPQPASYRGAWWIVPNGPYGLSAASGAAGVTLRWVNNSDNEDGLRVYRSSDAATFSIVADLAAGSTGFVDPNVVAGTHYEYAVFAYNLTGISSVNFTDVVVAGSAPAAPVTSTSTSTPSPVTSAPTQPVSYRGKWWLVPNAPYGFTAWGNGSNAITLNWSLNSDNEDGLTLQRSVNSGTFQSITVPYGTTSFVDTSVSAGNQYAYRVNAFNGHGASSFTDTVTATTSGSGTTTPTSPSIPTPPATGTSSAAGFFPTAVYYQPAYSFNTWKSRGINTLYGYESQSNGVSMQTWSATAQADGLDYIRQASSDLQADAIDPNLLAWLTPTDEPDLHGTDPASLLQAYTSLKGASPSKPVVTTYSGGHVIGWQSGISTAAYQQYFNATDWIGSDLYPVTGWGFSNLNGVGNLVDRVAQLAPGKKQFAFIETSNQQLPWVNNDRGVTPDELRGEIWDAVIHGAGGIAYFPQQIGNGFAYDATPANVAAEMTTQDARLQQYGAALNSQANPSWLQLYSTNGSSPIEATWRSYGGKNYFFVLNLSNQTLSGQQLTVNGISAAATVGVDGESRNVTLVNGTLTDSFAPYQMHVYVA